jgi:hypothetical protein
MGATSQYSIRAAGGNKRKEKKEELRRQWKPLPTLVKEKEPLWYRHP